ncbi:hypothetical protein F5141DRAFT_1272354 [Pisolithus sp. B1]|nr:hypothetical protein F5141DRAFT_1272354 [Pisolithus sp. B1]
MWMASNFERHRHSLVYTSTFGLESNHQFNTKSMARMQAKKRRPFGFVRISNPAAGLATSPMQPHARAEDVSPVSETLSMASRRMLVRMRHFFHRSSEGPSTTVATETTGTDICAEAQEQQGPHHLANNLELELTSEVIGKDIEAAVKALDDMNPILCIGKGVVEVVGLVDTAVIEAQSMSDAYLKPFKTFSQVVNNLSIVHPYTWIALVALTSASQLIILHANIDNAVSGLLDKVRNVYEFLLE